MKQRQVFSAGRNIDSMERGYVARIADCAVALAVIILPRNYGADCGNVLGVLVEGVSIFGHLLVVAIVVAMLIECPWVWSIRTGAIKSDIIDYTDQ